MIIQAFIYAQSVHLYHFWPFLSLFQEKPKILKKLSRFLVSDTITQPFFMLCKLFICFSSFYLFSFTLSNHLFEYILSFQICSLFFQSKELSASLSTVIRKSINWFQLNLQKKDEDELRERKRGREKWKREIVKKSIKLFPFTLTFFSCENFFTLISELWNFHLIF